MRAATGGGESQHRQLIADHSDVVCIPKRSGKCATRFDLDRRHLCVRSERRTSRSAVVHSSCHRPHVYDGTVNRYYDPATAQFLTVDPQVATTDAAYFYAGDDPVNGTDPNGLSWWNPVSWGRHSKNIGEIVAGAAILIGTGTIAIAAAVAFFPEDLGAIALEGTFLGAEVGAMEGFAFGLILQGSGLGGGSAIRNSHPRYSSAAGPGPQQFPEGNGPFLSFLGLLQMPVP